MSDALGKQRASQLAPRCIPSVPIQLSHMPQDSLGPIRPSSDLACQRASVACCDVGSRPNIFHRSLGSGSPQSVQLCNHNTSKVLASFSKVKGYYVNLQQAKWSVEIEPIRVALARCMLGENL